MLRILIVFSRRIALFACFNRKSRRRSHRAQVGVLIFRSRPLPLINSSPSPLTRSTFFFPRFQNGDLESGQTSCASNSVSRRPKFLRLKRTLNVALKVIFTVSVVALICGCVWYMMGFIFLVQLILVALVAYFFAGGGYKFLYIVYKTIWRDTT